MNARDPLDLRASRYTAKYGCKKCGLIGCSCSDVEDTFAASICKKCKCDPCECEGSRVARTVGGVCTVCRRNSDACICQSHHHVKQVLDVSVRENKGSTRPYTDLYLNTLVNEGMNHYYNRDAEGLARWLRKALR